MITKSRRWFYILWLVLLVLIGVPFSSYVKAVAGDVYTFDHQDYWKEYKEWSYLPGSRLPCNGSSEGACTWAWQPWYQHTTDIPIYGAEQWTGRTVSGYAMMMRNSVATNHNMNAGIFRVETNTKMCHTYRFTMNSRSGLEPQLPASPNAQMQLGISPTGLTPAQIVLTESDLNQIVWSPSANPLYTYQNMSVEAEALGTSVALYTRGIAPADGSPYFFWDEGSFTEVPRTGNLVDPSAPLPAPGGVFNAAANPTATSAWVTWQTAYEAVGQVLYRAVGSITPPADDYPHSIYLPLVVGPTSSAGGWTVTPLQTWATSQSVQLTNLQPGTQYEYVTVSYGLFNGACGVLTSESNPPRTFTTLDLP